jgi:RNA polymerase sigma-70 factor (ECF subfamily)
MLDDRDVRRLLLSTVAHDAAAFEELYRKTAPLLLAVALRVVGRRELAEEVLHDGFLKIWHSARSFDPTAAHPVAWMVAIIRNRAIDLVSSADLARVEPLEEDAEGVLAQILDTGSSADQLLEGHRRARSVRDCLAELEAPERQALVLAYHHGLSHGDLARHLNRPLGTVKSWVRRALQNLRICVEACIGDPREAPRAS